MDCNRKEHVLAKIHFKKKFFCKMFLISLILFIISALIVFCNMDCCATMAQKYYGLQPDDYSCVTAMLFGAWKILIIQFTLVPFLATYFMEKHVKDKCSHVEEKPAE